MERIVQLADSRHFDVYIANSPLYQGLLEAPEFRFSMAQLDAKMNYFAKQSPWIHRIAATPVLFRAAQMQSTDHLIASAAQIHTEALASEIKSLEFARQDPRQLSRRL